MDFILSNTKHTRGSPSPESTGKKYSPSPKRQAKKSSPSPNRSSKSHKRVIRKSNNSSPKNVNILTQSEKVDESPVYRSRTFFKEDNIESRESRQELTVSPLLMDNNREFMKEVSSPSSGQNNLRSLVKCIVDSPYEIEEEARKKLEVTKENDAIKVKNVRLEIEKANNANEIQQSGVNFDVGSPIDHNINQLLKGSALTFEESQVPDTPQKAPTKENKDKVFDKKLDAIKKRIGLGEMYLQDIPMNFGNDYNDINNNNLNMTTNSEYSAEFNNLPLVNPIESSGVHFSFDEQNSFGISHKNENNRDLENVNSTNGDIKLLNNVLNFGNEENQYYSKTSKGFLPNDQQCSYETEFDSIALGMNKSEKKNAPTIIENVTR